MKISVVGTGYVGLVTGACFAETGNDVVCQDIDAAKVDRLRRGEIPFFEPGLSELVERNVREGRLVFSSDAEKALSAADIVFVCVGTPSKDDGAADLRAVFDVADTVAAVAPKGTAMVIKSTVPIGSGDKIRQHLAGKNRADIRVAANPEFLREGSAVQDCLFPDRVVVGTNDPTVAEKFRELYAPFLRTGKPIFIMDVRSAEMSKYAANAYLAMRISFINEMSMICERVGADVRRVREAMGADSRIGAHYLFPSIGFGGSCFPKDVRALLAVAREANLDTGLLQSTLEVNDAQKRRFSERVVRHFGGKGKLAGRKVAVWGLAFKAKTDDIRESPALTVIDALLAEGAKLSVFDPEAHANARQFYGDRIAYASNAFAAIEGAEALCVLTEWNQFRHPDFARMKKLMKAPVIFDGRNLYDPAQVERLGFSYWGIGQAGRSNTG